MSSVKKIIKVGRKVKEVEKVEKVEDNEEVKEVISDTKYCPTCKKNVDKSKFYNCKKSNNYYKYYYF